MVTSKWGGCELYIGGRSYSTTHCRQEQPRASLPYSAGSFLASTLTPGRETGGKRHLYMLHRGLGMPRLSRGYCTPQWELQLSKALKKGGWRPLHEAAANNNVT